MTRACRAILAILAWGGLICMPAPPSAAAAGPLYNKPVYDPATKSYFELYFPDRQAATRDRREAGRLTWAQADDIAKTQFHQGARGRLAVVKNLKTSIFLIRTFQPQRSAWIGLQYLCSYRVLQWVTGEIWPVTAYADWGPVWNVAGDQPYSQGRATCGNGSGGALPVHYWGVAGRNKWNANEPRQAFATMFIEFPTGHP